MRNNMFKTWLLIVFLAICGTTSFASCSSDDEHPSTTPPIDSIRQRGKILVGTTGDYRPLSFREADGTYWGLGIEMAREIAAEIGVDIE
ncbi:MAG: transporter substrate-binding domain-containing protein, partial [Prevotella sp.]|nr:transporter substrate-binding domain-containing protein [Prevotella sp.]